MKVLFLSTTMGMGGADQQLLTLADGLRSRGHEVMIASHAFEPAARLRSYELVASVFA